MLALAGSALVAAPAVAATSARGTVLQIDRGTRTLRVVADHQAHAYRLRGPVPAAVRVGSRIVFHAGRGSAWGLVAHGRVHAIAVRGVVVRRQRRLAIRLADGRFFGRATRGRHAAGVAISFRGLKPGQLVEVDLRLSRRGIAATVRPAGDDGCGACGGRLDVSGIVVSVDTEAGELSVDPGGDGDIVTFEVAAEPLAALTEGDCVEVVGDLAADGAITAGSITASVACGDAGDDAGDDTEVLGTVSALAAGGTGFTLTTDDGGSIELGADEGVLEGIAVGARVDVYYYVGDDGGPVADEVDAVDGLDPADRV